MTSENSNKSLLQRTKWALTSLVATVQMAGQPTANGLLIPTPLGKLARGFAVICFLSAAWMMGGDLHLESHTAASEIADHPEAESSESGVSSIHWDEIDAIANPKSKYTALQKKGLCEKYAGKSVKWTGKVSEMRLTRDGNETFGVAPVGIRMNDDSPDGLADLTLYVEDRDERMEALKLSVGDEVTFIGSIDWIESATGTILVGLRNAEIVAVKQSDNLNAGKKDGQDFPRASEVERQEEFSRILALGPGYHPTQLIDEKGPVSFIACGKARIWLEAFDTQVRAIAAAEEAALWNALAETAYGLGTDVTHERGVADSDQESKEVRRGEITLRGIMPLHVDVDLKNRTVSVLLDFRPSQAEDLPSLDVVGERTIVRRKRGLIDDYETVSVNGVKVLAKRSMDLAGSRMVFFDQWRATGFRYVGVIREESDSGKMQIHGAWACRESGLRIRLSKPDPRENNEAHHFGTERGDDSRSQRTPATSTGEGKSEGHRLKVSVGVAKISWGHYRKGDDCSNLGYYLQNVLAYKDTDKGTLTLKFDMSVEGWRKTHGDDDPISRLPEALRVELFDENDRELAEFRTQERFCFAPTRDEFNAGGVLARHFYAGLEEIEEKHPKEAGEMRIWYLPDKWQQFVGKSDPAAEPWPGVLLLKSNDNRLTFTVNARDLDYSTKVRISALHLHSSRHKDGQWVYSEFEYEGGSPSEPQRDKRSLEYITGESARRDGPMRGIGVLRQVDFKDVKEYFESGVSSLCSDAPGLPKDPSAFVVGLRSHLLALMATSDCCDSRLTEEEAIHSITSLKRPAKVKTFPRGIKLYDVPYEETLAIQRKLADSAFKRFASEYAAMQNRLTASADLTLRLETIFLGNWEDHVFVEEPSP